VSSWTANVWVSRRFLVTLWYSASAALNIALLLGLGYTFLKFAPQVKQELAEARAGRRVLPKRAVILTFDDGRSDALSVVLPLLRKRGMRATFFIITGRVGEPGFLTWEGVRALAAAGMEIGSHTQTHPRLPDLTDEAAEEELEVSKARLQKEIGQPVEVLAYPYNALRSHTASLVAAAGYRVAVAGTAHGTSDLLRLRRYPVNGFTSLAAIQQMTAH